MGEKCEKCETTCAEIYHIKGRLTTLETFQKWAEPILNGIKLLRSDTKWMKIIALAFISIVTWVYIDQVLPILKQQSDDKIERIKQQSADKAEILKQQHADKIEIIREMYKGQQELRKEIMGKLSQTTRTINQHSTKSSKLNYKGIAKVVRKEVRSIKD